MNDGWSVLIAGSTGIIGSVIGAAVNEWLRRSNRIESYSSKIFDKRLAAYEGLFERFREGGSIATTVMTNTSLSADERHDAVSLVIQDLAQFTDANSFYLDEEVAVHCVATFMGAEDVLAAETVAAQTAAQDRVYKMFREGQRMILEDSGLAGVDRLLKKVARPKLSSPLISYLRAQRAKQKKAGG